MKKLLSTLLASAFLSSAAWATPSTTFWTPATTYVQPYLVPHLTYDSYVSEKSALQNTYGLTIGVLPWDKLQGEIGVDVLLPGYVGDNLLLNAKLGVPENAFGGWSPGISAGVYGVGFKSNWSDWDVLHAELSKTVPIVGTLVVGGYYALGPDTLFTSSAGEVNHAGFMGAWTSPDVNLGLTGLNKINFMADVQTGNNFLGAVGGGIGIFFTPAIDVLTGPVYFFDSKTTVQIPGPRVALPGSDWMWTVQLDVDFDLRSPKPAEPAKS